MPVTVKFFSILREVTATDSTNVEAKNIKSLLDKLIEKFGPKFADLIYDPGTKRLRSSVIILVNGHSIRTMKGLETDLTRGDIIMSDIVTIFQAVGGG